MLQCRTKMKLFTVKRLVQFLLVAFASLSTSLANAQPQPTYDPDIYFLCRVSINGTFVNKVVFVPLDVPNNPPTGNGTFVYYPVGAANRKPTHVNCHGQQYPYGVATINGNWTVTMTINGQNVVFNKATNKSYWDWHYEGYAPPADVDYTQNCHGYTFDKGDWPDDAKKLVNLGQLPTPCFIPSLVNQATIATDVRHSDRHSMKVSGILCDHPSIPSLKVPKYKTSSEQYRESGVYSQDQGCPNGIDIFKAHTLAKHAWADPNYVPPQLEAFRPN